MNYSEEEAWFKSLQVGDHVLVTASFPGRGTHLAKGTVTVKTPKGGIRVETADNLAGDRLFKGTSFFKDWERVTLEPWNSGAELQVSMAQRRNDLSARVCSIVRQANVLPYSNVSLEDLEVLNRQLEVVQSICAKYSKK